MRVCPGGALGMFVLAKSHNDYYPLDDTFPTFATKVLHHRGARFILQSTDNKNHFGGKISKALLMLEDGRLFEGRSCGAPGTTTGEVCFNTAMTGYSEVLTDPSYHGQILTLTTAEVGVYGVSPEDFESDRIQVSGFIVKRMSPRGSSWRAKKELRSWLIENGVVAVEGLDTRALTRHLRGRGAMKGVLTTNIDLSQAELLTLARSSHGVDDQDFTAAVTRPSPETWYALDEPDPWYDLARNHLSAWPSKLNIVLYDFGTKSNIARQLTARGCDVTLVPASTTADTVLEMNPHGVLLSNGPGDPSACGAIVDEIRKLIGNVPLGGICLGHQLLALACGARTSKLPFGHRGSNHPVRILESGKVLITSQNHGFTVRRDSVERAGLELTHVSLNDGSVEGFRHPSKRVMSVQFHPESSPGPHDAHFDFFNSFLELVDPESAEMISGAKKN